MNLSFLKVENTGILISGPPQVKCRHLIYSISLVMSLMILWTPEVDQMLKSGDLLEFQSIVAIQSRVASYLHGGSK